MKMLSKQSRPLSLSSSSSIGLGGEFLLTCLPDVPLDKVISYLEPEDLRRFHQVSRGWKRALEQRPRENVRRLDLVKQIKENRENIPKGPDNKELVPVAVTAFRAARDQRKSEMDLKKNGESPALLECTNQFRNTPETSNLFTPDYSSALTPTSRFFTFQDFEEAEKSLEPGQKLLQCRRCRGPVPSPVSSHENAESRRSSSQSTRCKLITRLHLDKKDYHHLLDSPEKRESKKAKTLSAADLSPIPYNPPVTVASLGEKMTHSLVLSSPCLTFPTLAQHNSDQVGTSTPRSEIKRSSSCTSIGGIDLPTTSNGGGSPIDLSLNFSKDNFDGLSSIDLNFSSEDLNCLRSCCQIPDMHASQFSDSGFSHDSESNTPDVEFANWIPSPVVPVVGKDFDSQLSYSNSIERIRNLDFHNSSGALSIPSMHLQRSEQNISVGNSIIQSQNNLNTTLECPNPNCRYRFCSNCEEGEHPERACRLLSSDHIESLFDHNGSNSNSENYTGMITSCSSITDSSRDSSTSKKNKAIKQKNHKKSSLKRLARLKQD